MTLGGELLANAEALLREGLHTAEIADGYAKACTKVRNRVAVDRDARPTLFCRFLRAQPRGAS